MGTILTLLWSGLAIFFEVVDMRPKSDFLLSLSINHACDVINLNINERVQKSFAPHHFELVLKISILIVILASICQYAHVICIRFHRNLCEGQEIDRKSKIFAPYQLKSFGWIFYFLDSFHPTWSSWDVINLFDVYRLMSHVIRSKTFFDHLLS